MLKKFLLYFHTIKYLKFRQIFFRIYYYLRAPNLKKNLPALQIRQSHSLKSTYPLKEKIYFSESQIMFLNHPVNFSNPKIWQDNKQEKLWLYQLHYFDVLNGVQQKEAYALLERWVDENPPLKGIGWEPFPVSLRIVNIIKYALSGNTLSKKIIESLYFQARFLFGRCEYHLLGNHLFENYKALCLSGLFFETQESKKWFTKGYHGITREIKEQVLPDGGHFELSPMYHSIFLEGLLDLDNIFFTYQKDFLWKTEVEKMLFWLQGMQRNENELSYFNDTTNDFAAPPKLLYDYATKLGFHIASKKQPVIYLKESGYAILQNDRIKLIADVGNIGPNYLPAHAHADTLSFELMIDDIPVLVNLGISCYGCSSRRQFERGTSAHNTVVVDHKNSSQVWGTFRVGKRARVKNIVVKENSIEAEHNGYSSVMHKRIWNISEDNVLITDILNTNVCDTNTYLHLHPKCVIKPRGKNQTFIFLPNQKTVSVSFANSDMMQNEFAIGFGNLCKTSTLQAKILAKMTTPRMIFQLQVCN